MLTFEKKTLPFSLSLSACPRCPFFRVDSDPFLLAFLFSLFWDAAALQRAILARKIFIPFGSTKRLELPKIIPSGADSEDITLPEGVSELVLWQDENKERQEENKLLPPVKVDNMLTRWLRPHQREGVAFLYECVMGLRGFDGAGCILADDMGLGKTLQAISLMWTLLNTSIEENQEPTVKKVVIVCPTSLVANWDAECIKWLKGKVKTTPICGDSRADAESSVKMFLAPTSRSQVLIVSYETFRIYHERFTTESSCQLVICDEAHRLKNGETLTNQALAKMACKRRIMLSGTPMQNHLDEFYSMVSFCNPGILGTPKEFAKKYERPILAGREPDATDAELEKANERNEMLSVIVNKFILRRTNTILTKHLPPKVIEVVCCKTTPMQRSIYEHLLSEKARVAEKTGKQVDVLACITALKKLCNHPKLIFDAIREKKYAGKTEGGNAIDDSLMPYFHGLYDGGGSGRGGRGSGQMCEGWEWHGGKFAVLARLLHQLRTETSDRIVIISNYTQTLDLVEVLCRQNNYPSLRLDGGTSINKRQKLVNAFNDLTNNEFVFLLSSKAGGCGINLVGGNRLVLFDPDWNPANDKQAAARCWRDGQKKKCYEYRFLSSGTIEEKVYQRQLAKQALTSVVDGRGSGLEQMSMTTEDLQQLFSLDVECPSDTHRKCDCTRCPDIHRKIEEKKKTMNQSSISSEDDAIGGNDDGGQNDILPEEKQLEDFDEAKLNTWAHHYRMSHVPDVQLRKAAGEDVTFVFSLEVDGAKIAEMQERALALAEKKRKENPVVAKKDQDEEEDEEKEDDSDRNGSSSSSSSLSSLEDDEKEEDVGQKEQKETVITAKMKAKALKDVSSNEMETRIATTNKKKNTPICGSERQTSPSAKRHKAAFNEENEEEGEDDTDDENDLKDEDPVAAAAALPVKEKTNKKKQMARKNSRKLKDAPITCVGCNRNDDKKDMISCVGCERKFHYFCNDPPLKTKPTKRTHPMGWFCNACKEKEEEEEDDDDDDDDDGEKEEEDDDEEDEEEEEVKNANKSANKRKSLPEIIILSDDYSEKEDDDQVPDSEEERDDD